MESAGTGRLYRRAATGVVVARDQRRRRAYTPAEVRERLHARLAAGDAAAIPRPHRTDRITNTRPVLEQD